MSESLPPPEEKPKLSHNEKTGIIDQYSAALLSKTVLPEFALKEISEADAGLDQDSYREYYNRYRVGELTKDELIRWDNDWLKALKEKDKLKKPDIITGGGFQARRDAIAQDKERRLTDLGNSERLIDQYSADIRYCHQFISWYIWNYQEGRWKKDDNGYIYRIAKDVTRRILNEASKMGEGDVRRKRLSEWAFVCENRSHINGMVDLAQNDKAILMSPDQMDQDDFKFNMRNGVFDLKTFSLGPHDKSLNITRLANYDYDERATCPKFLNFLERSFKSNKKKDEIIGYIQRAVGYTLTGSTAEQALFLLYGSGANGKSVLLGIIRALQDEYGTVTQSRTFTTDRGEISNDIAALAGVRFVSASENSSDTILDESTIKQLTGGEEVSARFLHQEFFTFLPKFKIWWSFNHPPAISDMTISIWRRIKIIPFTETIPEEEWDKQLLEKLKGELPGIFNWAIEGLKSYYKNGLQEPEEVTKATKSYKNDQDILLDFFTTSYEFTNNENDRIKASDLYQSYKSWWNFQESTKPMSSTRFGRLCRDRGMKKIEGRDGNYYTGLKVMKR
jgi:putative DNA primase/helicase